MNQISRLFTFILTLTAIFSISQSAHAGGSAPKSEEPAKPEIVSYNEGFKLMTSLKFVEAQAKFEQALAVNESFPEAHNNLAFSLRKQGDAYFTKALEHYNRAIALNPKLPEPYMYRGVLYTLTKKADLAAADLETLKGLSRKLAQELEWVIANGKEKSPEGFFGVSKRLN